MGTFVQGIINSVPNMVGEQMDLSIDDKSILNKDEEITSWVIKMQSDRLSTISDKSLFSQQYFDIVAKIGSAFKHARDCEQLPYGLLHQIAYVDIYELLREDDWIVPLCKFRHVSRNEAFHAANVGILAGLLGFWSKYGKQTVQALILSGVMHDIGKTQSGIDTKQTFGLHNVYGYYLVKSLPDYAPGIEFAILQHHERENGGGYPGGIHAHTIHPYAKVVAIADAYDRLTSNWEENKGNVLFDALECLVAKMFVELDPQYCMLFIRNVLFSLHGATVLLSDGEQAEVMCWNSFMSTKPILKRESGKTIDLSQNAEVYISKIIYSKDSKQNRAEVRNE
ncbi:MAG: HD-GYP domain-containing protein [Negativicutes bacterium]